MKHGNAKENPIRNSLKVLLDEATEYLRTSDTKIELKTNCGLSP